MFAVVYSNEFEAWFKSLTDGEQDDVLSALKLLTVHGHQLARPYADTLKGSKLANLKELRIQHAGRPYRALFVFDPQRKAVVLCAGDKTGDKRFYKRMIPLAERIYQDYLNEVNP